MKKSLIWLLTIVMSIAFGGLLYFQIMYLDNMAKMRNEQFSEGVMRALNATAVFLERQETLHFLEQDVNIIESGFYDINNEEPAIDNFNNPGLYADGNQNLGERYLNMQKVIRSQFLYQKGLLTEVILTILRESGNRPVMERADSTMINESLKTELIHNGVNLPYTFAIYNQRGDLVYNTEGFSGVNNRDLYSITLFNNSNTTYKLTVEFPTKSNYIFSSVRFIIPTLALSVILMIIFIFTILLVFRQKKLTEMKSDFINNMTHELKTPISTISLAGQMLSDPSVRKSPGTLNHLSQVITEESKRLRFQVEKVLQMSVFDNTGSAMKFDYVDANVIIQTVVNTFKIKVEKYGGRLETNLSAQDAIVYVDEMQFTNVVFNLLDNAVKYMRDDVEPDLEIMTADINGNKLEIRISDNGIGIKKEDLKRIFDKFYRVPTGNRHDVKGFGLGLAYVKKMITVFGGSITAESEFGVGSTFVITLPLADT